MTYCHRDGCLTAHLRSCSRIILPNYITYTQHVSRLVDMQPQAGSDLHDGAPHGKVFNQQSPKPNPFVYLSNLSVDAYEGAIRKAFEKEGIHVVSTGHCVGLGWQLPGTQCGTILGSRTVPRPCADLPQHLRTVHSESSTQSAVCRIILAY